MKLKEGWHALRPGYGWECTHEPYGAEAHEPCGAEATYVKNDGTAACDRHARRMGALKPRRNTPRKTARERAVYVINRGAMAEDIEKQIQLAVKAYAKRKANR